MGILYEISIRVLYALSHFKSLWDIKTKQWLKAQKASECFDLILPESPVWIHCASLGELETVKGLWDQIRTQNPEAHFVFSFFSTSGLNPFKLKYPNTFAFLLPLDTGANMNRLLSKLGPRLLIISENDIWINMLKVAKCRNVPVISVSSSFRSTQFWFTSYGRFFSKKLHLVDQIFTKDKQSKTLLEKYNFKNVAFSGDLRIDQILLRKTKSKNLSKIEQFKDDQKILIAASVYPDEYAFLVDAFSTLTNTKLIVVPHDPEHFAQSELFKSIHSDLVFYSKLSSKADFGRNILFVDQFGLLFDIYKYCDFAYVGGGFGNGVHNTIEPLVHGLPVIIGPNHVKFSMIQEFIEAHVIYSINDRIDFKQGLDWIAQWEGIKEYEHVVNTEIAQRSGGIKVVMDYILKHDLI